MSAQLEVIPTEEPVERIEADLVAVGWHEDERPLRGGAGRIDWRLCGLVSSLVHERRVRGRPGEALLVPGGGRLGAPRALLVGMGPRAEADARQRARTVAGILRRALALRAEVVALEPPGPPSAELALHAEPVLEGALEALRGSDVRLALRIPVPEGESAAAARLLASASRDLPSGVKRSGVELLLPSQAVLAAPSGSPQAPRARRQAPPGAPSAPHR